MAKLPLTGGGGLIRQLDLTALLVIAWRPDCSKNKLPLAGLYSAQYQQGI
jgi:hypothetical protein